MPAWLPIIAGVGTLASIIQGAKANKNQKKALNQQGRVADQQQSLFQTAQPHYGDALAALRNHAGLNPGGGMFQPAEDKLRMQQAEQAMGQGLERNIGGFGMDMARRGMGGSSFEAAGLAALRGAAGRNLDQMRMQQAIDAPREQERRIAMLLQALNPGLSGGMNSANILGNQAAVAGNQLAGAQAGIGGALQAYLQYEALRKLNNPAATSTPQTVHPATAGAVSGAQSFTPPFVEGQNQVSAQLQALLQALKAQQQQQRGLSWEDF